LFDTRGTPALTPANFAEVAYASSRMMHAWDIPATIEGRPYVDASYLCSIPVEEVGALGAERIIAISADPPQTRFADMFGTRTVPERVGATPVHFISPQIDPATLGADFTDATHEGLSAVYAHGEEVGRAFCAEFG
jgi:predicted acylesterase/phospholipase RssA